MEYAYLTPELEKKLTDLLRQAGEIMLGALSVEDSVSAKPGTRNYVTAYDVRVQRFMTEKLREVLPGAAFLGEEEENHYMPPEGPCFVLDPIDGTLNFIHDFRCSCVSLGIAEAGDAVWGGIWNPYTRELFTARRGGGAYLNGKPIRVTEHRLDEAMVAVGTSPYIRDRAGHETFVLAEKVFMASADVRRCGSAAYEFCMLACGRQDGFYEMVLGPWDFCAAKVILEEAGGIMTRMDGRPLHCGESCSVLAANRACYAELLELTKGVVTPDRETK